MKIFISWSGKRSMAVAHALNEWIPQVIQAVEPWMSPDIEKGKPWNEAISRQLEECSVGIICVTKENVTSPWLCFEAGALSKTKDAYACTFLLDLKHAAVQPPLGTFQHTVAEKDDVRKLIHTINNALAAQDEKSLDAARLNKIFDQFWGDLEATLEGIKKIEVVGAKVPDRPDREILSEILDIVRNQQRERNSNTTYDSILTALNAQHDAQHAQLKNLMHTITILEEESSDIIDESEKGRLNRELMILKIKRRNQHVRVANLKREIDAIISAEASE